MHVADWLENIGQCLRFQTLGVWVGCSYLMLNKENDMVYVYCAKDIGMFSTKLETKVFKLIRNSILILTSLNGLKWLSKNSKILTSGTCWRNRLPLMITSSQNPAFDLTKLLHITVGFENKIYTRYKF